MEAFDLTYRDHLAELQQIDFANRAHARGLELRSDKIVIPFFGRPSLISKQDIVDSDGKAPTPAVATVLLTYVLRNENIPLANPEKITFRDFIFQLNFLSRGEVRWNPPLFYCPLKPLIGSAAWSMTDQDLVLPSVSGLRRDNFSNRLFCLFRKFSSSRSNDGSAQADSDICPR